MLARMVLTACVACLLGSVPRQGTSQSCALSSGDLIADAIRRGCTRIMLNAGTYDGRFTVDRALRIAGASETADPLEAVITANGGPVITVTAAGDLQLARLTLRGSGGEVVEPGVESAEPVVEIAEPGVESAEPVVEIAEPGAESDEPGVGLVEPDEESVEAGVENVAAGEQSIGPGAEIDEAAVKVGEPAAAAPPGETLIASPDPNPRGGCIHNSGRARVNNVLLSQCFAAQSGGAVYNSAAASFSAVSSIFDSNRAAMGSGGAIASVDGAALTLQDTDFSLNVAQGWGGAVSASGLADAITGGGFSRNRAGGHGGAVALLSGGGRLVVDGATFDSNQAGSYGGALACFDRELVARDAEFRANRAQGGGGIYAARCDLRLDRARLLGNTAGETTNGHGGALMLQQGSLLVTGGWFEGNKAGHSGGGVFANARPASLAFEDTMVRDNHARVAGGGIRAADVAVVQVNGSQMIFNTAPQGGGVYLSNGSSSVKSSSFSGNHAGSEGGALLINDATVTVENSTFASNVADHSGGGVYLRHSVDASFRNATLYGNQAGERASSLFIGSGTAVGLSNTIVFDAGDTVGDCEVQGTLTVSGRNLDSDGSCNSDVSVDPRLEMLGAGETLILDDASVTDVPVDETRLQEIAAHETTDEVPARLEGTFEEAQFGDAADEESPAARLVPLALRPLAGSPAIDGGNDEVCTDYDQNGTVRPQDGDGDGEPECNLGAIER